MNALPRVVIAVSDLLFQTRIEGAAKHAGYEACIETGDRSELANLGGSILVVDVHETTFDAQRAIATAKDAGAQVLAFGRHTEPATLRRARESGADRVVPRSQLVEELPDLLRALADAFRAPQPQ